MNEEMASTRRRVRGRPVPVVAFYSASGGVGKSTLARKFAELATAAAGQGSARPNVLLVDLDVESHGLTYRLTQGLHANIPTVHEMLAQRNVSIVQAMDVTTAVSLASGKQQQRGHLYLVPSAPPDAKGIFDTLATINRQELLGLLKDLIQGLVNQYDISCVVLDCAPGAIPYSAAAAVLADVPLFVGRNEQPSYEGMRVIPERFREWYPEFQPASQKAIVNAVAVPDLFRVRQGRYAGVIDYIPLSTDVILEVEGLSLGESFQKLLLEKYVIDIMKQVFAGMSLDHLIPDTPEILGQGWVEALSKLRRCDKAPSMRRLHIIGYLRWLGAAMALFGAAAWGARRLVDTLPDSLSDIGMGAVVAGLVVLSVGWFAESRRSSTITAARELADSGPDEIMKRLEAGPSQRRQLDRFRELADSIPAQPRRRGSQDEDH
jgi:cellulose biosynthesis protein BcsQ